MYNVNEGLLGMFDRGVQYIIEYYIYEIFYCIYVNIFLYIYMIGLIVDD